MTKNPATCPAAMRAFSLAELLVAMMIVALLMAGIGSAVLISSHALPDRTAGQTTRMDAAALLDQIESELAYAVTVREREATSLAFAVPDRDGDGNAERVRYSYDAVARTISREYRGSAAQPVLMDVDAASFAYTYETVPVTYDGLPVEDASETLLSSNASGSQQRDFALSSTSWIGQLVSPSLSGDAVSWRVTRLSVLAERKRTSAADVRARVYPATPGGLPSSNFLEDQTLSGSLLGVLGLLPIISTYTSYEVNFSGAHGFEVGESAALVIGQLSGTAGTLNLSYAAGAGLLIGNSASWTWTLSSVSGMHHNCYGKITRRGSQTGFDRAYLTRVRVAIRVAGQDAARSADIIPLNRPETLSRHLHLDFLADPTQVDEDGDAQPDWVLLSGSAADIQTGGMLSNAVSYGATPDTSPAEHTIIELSFRGTQVGGESDALRIVTEQDGALGAAFFVTAALRADNTQTFSILDEQRTVLHDVEGLPNSLIEARVILDPKIDAISVSLNGGRADTIALPRTPLTFGGPAIQVGRLRDAVEIDDVCIHIQ